MTEGSARARLGLVRSAVRALAACALFSLWAVAAAAGNAAPVFPAAPERDLVVRVCTACHVPEMVIAKRHTPEEWDDIIAKMVDHGAQASDEEQQQILAYLVRFFGPAADTSGAKLR